MSAAKDDDKDTREQARAELEQRARRIASSPGDPIAPARLEWLTAVIDRARREGMEEAAGIVERMAAPSQMILRTATAQRVAANIRAAKEDDHG